MTARWGWVVAVAACAVFAGGCNAIFGLDAPRLAPPDAASVQQPGETGDAGDADRDEVSDGGDCCDGADRHAGSDGGEDGAVDGNRVSAPDGAEDQTGLTPDDVSDGDAYDSEAEAGGDAGAPSDAAVRDDAGDGSNSLCGADTCPEGCCDEHGACVPYVGQDDGRCGTGGAACRICPDGISCDTRGGICLGCGAGVTMTEDGLHALTVGNHAQFGADLVLRAGSMLVGASNVVYAVAIAGTTWNLDELLLPNHDTLGDAVTLALSPTGDTAVMATVPNGGMLTNWVFSRRGSSWFQVGAPIYLQVEGAPLGPIVTDGDVVVAGAPFAAYVYSTVSGAPTVLAPPATDYAPSAVNGSFGLGVAISGDSIFVSGSPFDSGSGQYGHRIYVFVRFGAGWAYQATLVPSDLAANSNPGFKATFAAEGDTVVLATSLGGYVFNRSGGTWTETQKLPVPSDNGGYFGASVALHGDLLLIGAPGYSATIGNVFVYGRSNGRWLLGPTLLAPTNSDIFGQIVAVGDGGTIAVSAPLESPNGAVYLYSCAPRP